MPFDSVKPEEVKNAVHTVMCPFGQDLVVDLERSHGCYVHDSLNKRDLLDFFSYFATNALGHNHPKETGDKEYLDELLLAARSNPSNSDFYTTQFGNFIETFKRVA